MDAAAGSTAREAVCSAAAKWSAAWAVAITATAQPSEANEIANRMIAYRPVRDESLASDRAIIGRYLAPGSVPGLGPVGTLNPC